MFLWQRYDKKMKKQIFFEKSLKKVHFCAEAVQLKNHQIIQKSFVKVNFFRIFAKETINAMPMIHDDPKEVARNLKRFLRQRGTLTAAAEELGVGPTTLSNQLAGKRYFTRKTASRYQALFGVNADYLVTGVGEIVENFNPPKNLFSLASEDVKQARTSVEDRIVGGIREQLEKLNDLGHTYNTLREHILEIAGFIGPGADNYDFCQAVISALNENAVKTVSVD